MAKPLLLGLLSMILVFVALAGAWPSFLRNGRDAVARVAAVGDPFAVGVFLGAGLIHLLPKAAVELGSGGSGYPLAFVLAGATMLSLGWIESHAGLSAGHRGAGGGATPIIATAALAFHSLLAGSALGAEPTDTAMLVLFVALIAHKGAASFALARLLTGGSLSRTTALALMAVFIAALPIGVLIGLLVTSIDPQDGAAIAVLLALGAGTFLYFGTVHRHFGRAGRDLATGLPTLAGFGLMAVIALAG